MSHLPLVVVGASAGGVEALQAMVGGLPADVDAAVLVVLHIPPTGPSALARILDRAGVLAASRAVDGEPLRAGHVYVASADRHLLVLDGRVRLSRGPAENGHRPAVDPLFRSAARAGRHRTVAVVLSGSRDDGTAGAGVVAERGGRVLVQDPDDALHPSMPRSVIEHVDVDGVCKAAELGPAIAEMLRDLPEDPPDDNLGPLGDDLAALETAVANLDDHTTDDLAGHPAGLACPSCHGALFELPGEPMPRFRCPVGHAWSPQSLLEEQAAAFEGALWMALRSLEEKSTLAARMATSATDRDRSELARHFHASAEDASRAAERIRSLIGKLDALTEAPDTAHAAG